jgi:hypothetical protein
LQSTPPAGRVAELESLGVATRIVKTAILFLALATLALAASAADKSVPKTHSPFKTVVVRGNTIVATLHENYKRWVKLSDEHPRWAFGGESLTIRAGQVLSLGEGRAASWSYDFTPQFAPAKPGLSAICTYDTTTIGLGAAPNPKGGTQKSETLFIPAANE